MIRAVVISCVFSSILLWASDEKKPSYPFFPYDVVQSHELEPHRRTIPHPGVDHGFNQLHLTLTVSPTGEVVDAEATGDKKILKYWPELQGEVRQWKFMPFEKDGKPVRAQVEEYIDLVPPERPPAHHVVPPVLRPNSKVAITLQRSGCFGSCPAYSVTVSTEGIIFEGNGNVAAQGKHHSNVDPDAVRKLAKMFIASDFYSMDSRYEASVTDSPTYSLSLTVDGRNKSIVDYVGEWVGMPGVITELEKKVDAIGLTDRWISGAEGLVQTLEEEKFNFKSFQAQVMLKEAARQGKAGTVRELLEAGVSLVPLPAPKGTESSSLIPVETMGWLTAASNSPEVLQVLIGVGASRNDQEDKNWALADAARDRKLAAVQALIAYGADPNANLKKPPAARSDDEEKTEHQKSFGSVLIYAADSGSPEVVREILRYHPKLEMRDPQGRTALFGAAGSGYRDQDGARVECVRLLAEAGADVNARDEEGNTPLHKTFLTDVEEELLKLGADVNARNDDGETPIFTTVDDDAIPLFIQHGADLTIRNNEGKTVLEAAKKQSPHRQEVLSKAMLQQAAH
jgi:ankyrin repeat protein